MRPVLAPLRCRSVFVATVVPWARYVTRAAAMPFSVSSCSRRCRIPAAGSVGPDGTFPIVNAREASSISARSVKVPPTSTPTRYPMVLFPRRLGHRHVGYETSGFLAWDRPLEELNPRPPGEARGATYVGT